MEDQPHVRASDLQALAIAKFDKSPLLNAEKVLIENVVTGGWAYCGPKPKDTGPNDRPPTIDNDANNNPQEADKWTEKENRQIRAELVAWLCSDQKARERVHPRGIQVYGAVVTDDLYLSLLNIPFQLAFQHCRLNTIYLQQAEVLQLDLQGSLVDGIRADSLIVKANVAFRGGFTANGEVRLPFAQIGGILDCSGGTFINPADCSGGKFTNPPQQDTKNPKKKIESSGSALDLSGVNVKGYVFLSKDFTAIGEVSLVVAQIGSVLDCSGGKFTNPPQQDTKNPKKKIESSGSALNASGIDVKGYVFLSKDFTAIGEVNLVNAQVGGLDCSGGTFTNRPKEDVPGSGTALKADGIVIKGDAFLSKDFTRKDFTAIGEVSLVVAQIGSVLDCSGGKFTNPPQRDTKNTEYIKYIEGSGSALNADGITVKGGVFLRNGFKAVGRVNLYGAQVGGTFVCIEGNFEEATLDLRDASAASLWDSGLNDNPDDKVADTKWPPQLSKQPSEPPPCELLLDGFDYRRISSKGNINATKRLEWLGRGWKPGEPFRRQPYLHLAKVLQDSGDSDGALRVRVRMEKLSRRSEAGGKPSSNWRNKIIRPIRIGIARSWSWFLRWSIGYGYYPMQAILFIILLSALGSIVYDRSYRAGTMVPTDDKTYKEFIASNAEPRVLPHYPSFSPLFYSLENSLPLVKFGQGEKWHPVPSRFATSPWLVTCFLRIQILLGWLFATLFVAGVSGVVHKE